MLEEELRKLFPSEWLCDFKMPYVEDLANDEVFLAFRLWRKAEGLHSEGWIAPDWSCLQAKASLDAAQGQQSRVHIAKDAFPPIIDPSLTKDEHFQQAAQLGCSRACPWHAEACVDADLRFAATKTVERLEDLREFRRGVGAVVGCLSSRCEKLTAVLRRHQPPTVRAVAGDVHIGLIAVLVVLTCWPDRSLALRFVQGFRIVGQLEVSGVFPEVLPEACDSKDDLLRDADHANATILKPREDDAASVLLEAAEKDRAAGRASKLLRKCDLDAKWGKGKWRTARRFSLVQGDKVRPIDDAKLGGQNNATTFSEKIVLCSPGQPVLDARALVQAAEAAGRLSELVKTKLESWDTK